jgi:hypothetical protein
MQHEDDQVVPFATCNFTGDGDKEDGEEFVKNSLVTNGLGLVAESQLVIGLSFTMPGVEAGPLTQNACTSSLHNAMPQSQLSIVEHCAERSYNFYDGTVLKTNPRGESRGLRRVYAPEVDKYELLRKPIWARISKCADVIAVSSVYSNDPVRSQVQYMISRPYNC